MTSRRPVPLLRVLSRAPADRPPGPGRVLVPVDPLLGAGTVDQLVALRWAVEAAHARVAEVILLCPVELPVTFGILPDSGALTVLLQRADAQARGLVTMVPPGLRSGVAIALRLQVGGLATILRASLGRGDLLVLPPIPDAGPARRPGRGRFSGGRPAAAATRLAAAAGATVVQAAYAQRAAGEEIAR